MAEKGELPKYIELSEEKEIEIEMILLLKKETPEDEIWDFYKRIENRDINPALNNFILQAEWAKGKIGGGDLYHRYDQACLGLTGWKNWLDERLDLSNMTFAQLKQEEPDFLKGILNFMLRIIKFGKIMDIPELKF